MTKRQGWLILAALSLIVMVQAGDDNGTWIMGAILYTIAWCRFWWEWFDERERKHV